MDDTVIAGHLENLDRRLARVEQILPTLATKEELRLAIAAAVAPLATKEELSEEGERSRRHLDIVAEALRTDTQLLAEHLAQILPTLATKAELREEGERSRRHMDIVSEALRADIQLLAEHLASGTPNPREG